MPRAFKTKCEENESNDILITYLYILMASTYMWMNIHQFIKQHQHVKIKPRHVNSYQIISEDHDFLYLTTRSFRKHVWSQTFSSLKTRKFKNTGILSIKIPLNVACRNRYLDFCCILTVMIPELMSRAICCKKIIIINRNGLSHVLD